MPDAFVARQPIFNHRLEAVSYELLFRGGYVNEAHVSDPERATATVLLNSLTELDLKRVVGRKPAWVNVSREFLTGGLARAIPPGLVGLEVLEADLADDRVVGVVRQLKTDGYRLSLDDFQSRPCSLPHLGLFDVVKLSFAELGPDRFTEQVNRLKSHPGTVVAEKLATHPDHEFSVSAGCDLFQGYFFCQPAVVCTRGISANRLALLQVVGALQDPNVELPDVEKLISRDVALSFRLLRYVNSAYFGLRGEVRSIGQALALLGLENVRRWATLSVLATIDDKPTELAVTALIRAHFCELAGSPLGVATPAELFTLGLFSVIDAMMDAPMSDVVESLPFATDVREALVLRRGKLGLLLSTVVALEAGDYGSAPTIVNRAGELYLESLMWANTAAASLFGEGEAEAPAVAPQVRPTLKAARTPVLATMSTSKPPPGTTLGLAAEPERLGFFARLWSRVLGVFGGGSARPARGEAR